MHQEYRFLLTGNFKQTFMSQINTKHSKVMNRNELNTFLKDLGRIDIKDGKKGGHKVYGLKEISIKTLMKRCLESLCNKKKSEKIRITANYRYAKP